MTVCTCISLDIYLEEYVKGKKQSFDRTRDHSVENNLNYILTVEFFFVKAAHYNTTKMISRNFSKNINGVNNYNFHTVDRDTLLPNI